MKKFLAIVSTLILTVALAAFTACVKVGGNEPKEINQWDYFDQFVRYGQYEYLEEPPSDWSRSTISNSYGENQPHCWNFVGNYGDVSIIGMNPHSDYDYYSSIRVLRKTGAKSITMQKLSLLIYAEADCEMNFSLSITGDNTPRATKIINAAANTATELLFEEFAEYTWTANSTSQVIIRLENPSAIGNVKYAFSDLKLTLKNNV